MSFMPLSFLPFSKQIQRLPIPSMLRLREERRTWTDDLQDDCGAAARSDGSRRSAVDAVECDGSGGRGRRASRKASTTMTDQQLHDECVTIILAGHETTANALSFALHLLAHHPEVQQRLADEAAEVLGDGLRRPPTTRGCLIDPGLCRDDAAVSAGLGDGSDVCGP